MLRRPRTALLGAAACVVGLVVTGALSHLVPAARVRDSASLKAFASFDSSSVNGILNGIAHLGDPLPYAIVMVALVLVAVHRGRRHLALAVPVVLLMAPVTTELLKRLTAQSRGGHMIASRVSEASWPSGHSTGAMALALCAVLVAPKRLRPLVGAIGGLFAMSVGYAVVALIWHFPSDVVGGFLVAAAWTLVAVAALRRWPDPVVRPERPASAPLGLGPLVGLASAFAVVALIVAFQHRGALADRLAGRPSFAVAAVAIAALAVGLAAALVRSASSD